MKTTNKVHKKVEGLWEVKCYRDTSTYLTVQKLNEDGSDASLIYRIYDSEETMTKWNKVWYGKVKSRFSHEELLSVKWPTYLNPGESERITVLPSGNFYVE